MSPVDVPVTASPQADGAGGAGGGGARRAGRITATSWEVIAECRYPNIHRGYRLHLSRAEALGSLIRLHNETLNVWTHLLGCVLFVGLLIYTVRMTAPAHTAPAMGDTVGCTLAALRAALSRGTPGMNATEAVDDGGRLLHLGASLAGALQAQRQLLPSIDSLPYLTAAQLPSLTGCVDHLQLDALSRMPARLRATLRDALAALSDRLGETVRALPPLPAVAISELRARRAAAALRDHLAALHDALAARPLAASATRAPAHAAGGADAAKPTGDDVCAAGAYHPAADARAGRPGAAGAAVAVGRARVERLLDTLAAEVAHAIDAAHRAAELGAHVERWPLYVYALSALVCLASSCAYHLFGTANDRWVRALGKGDYVGIVALIFGSCVPPMYYGFYASPAHRWAYLVGFTALSAALIALLLRPVFFTQRWRAARIALFVGFGLSGVLPLLHVCHHRAFDGLSTDVRRDCAEMRRDRAIRASWWDRAADTWRRRRSSRRAWCAWGSSTWPGSPSTRAACPSRSTPSASTSFSHHINGGTSPSSPRPLSTSATS